MYKTRTDHNIHVEFKGTPCALCGFIKGTSIPKTLSISKGSYGNPQDSHMNDG